MKMSMSATLWHEYNEKEQAREKKVEQAKTYTKDNREKFGELKRVKIIIPNYLLLNGKQLCWNSKLRKAALECVKRQWKQKIPNGQD